MTWSDITQINNSIGSPDLTPDYLTQWSPTSLEQAMGIKPFGTINMQVSGRTKTLVANKEGLIPEFYPKAQRVDNESVPRRGFIQYVLNLLRGRKS